MTFNAVHSPIQEFRRSHLQSWAFFRDTAIMAFTMQLVMLVNLDLLHENQPPNHLALKQYQ